MKKILVAHDGTKDAFRALLAATDLARKVGGRLTVVSVLPCGSLQNGAKLRFGQGRRKDVMQGVDEILRSEGVEGETVILSGEDPAQVIIDHACSTGADVVVVGSRTRRGSRTTPWGSVSSKVASEAPCAVFVV